MLSFGKPDEVRSFCRRVIREAALDGGYIADAGAIMQTDTSIENIRVMTDTFREFGAYSQSASAPALPPFALGGRDPRLVQDGVARPAGSVEPWAAAKSTLPEILGDEALVRATWQNLDAWSYAFLWHCVVSF